MPSNKRFVEPHGCGSHTLPQTGGHMIARQATTDPTIKKAIELDPIKRVTKMLQLRNKVKHHDFNWWLQHHLDEIEVFMSDFFEVNYERTS